MYPVTGNFPVNAPFSLRRSVRAKLQVFDLRGRLVRVLEPGELEAGEHVLVSDGKNEAAMPVASGTYFTVLRAGAEVRRGKLVVLR